MRLREVSERSEEIWVERGATKRNLLIAVIRSEPLMVSGGFWRPKIVLLSFDKKRKKLFPSHFFISNWNIKCSIMVESLS